jgi:hypothetical protein
MDALVKCGSRLCENSNVEFARRNIVSVAFNRKRTLLSITVEWRQDRKQFCALSARARFHTAWVNTGLMQRSKPSLDHFVGAGEKGARNRQPKRFGDALIQNQFKPARLNDGEISRARALQNTINISCCLPLVFSQIAAIRHQPARQYLDTVLINGGNTLSRGKLGNLTA